MVSGINSIQAGTFEPQISQRETRNQGNFESLTSFEQEDEAIISAEAKMLNELEKFNSGGDNLVDLAAATVMAKITTKAEVNVINAKKEMFDSILEMVE